MQQNCAQATCVQQYPRKLRPMRMYNWLPHCYQSEAIVLNMHVASLAGQFDLTYIFAE
jgi:hypothetical protein